MARQQKGSGRVTPKSTAPADDWVDTGPPTLRERSPLRFWLVIFIAILLVLSLVASLF